MRKTIPGFSRYEITENGEVWDTQTETWRNQYLTGKPKYKYVDLIPDGRVTGGTIFRVHRLVALTYIPNPDDLPMVDHKDQDKMNNHVSNLKWTTRGGNQRNMKNNIYLDYQGERVLLIDLVLRLYGEIKPHYARIWASTKRGDITTAEAVEKYAIAHPV